MIEPSTHAIWLMAALLKQPEWAGLNERLEEIRLRSVGHSSRTSVILNKLAEQGDEEVLRFMEAHRLAMVKQRLLGDPL